MENMDFKNYENFGVIGLVALFIWRLPNIIAAFTEGVKYIMNNVREVQNETLKTFKEQMDKDFEERMSRNSEEMKRYETMEETLKKATEAIIVTMEQNKQILEQQAEMRDRLIKLEAKK